MQVHIQAHWLNQAEHKREGKRHSREEQLHAELNALKKAGPHAEGSPGYTKMKELEFAIRSKTGWKKV